MFLVAKQVKAFQVNRECFGGIAFVIEAHCLLQKLFALFCPVHGAADAEAYSTASGELKHVRETALELPEEEPAQHKHRHRIRRDDRGLLQARPAGGEQALAIRAHDKR